MINETYQLIVKFNDKAICLEDSVLSYEDIMETFKGKLTKENLPILNFKQVSGKVFTDFLCPSSFLHIVSDRVIDLFTKNKINGWKSIPIEAKSKLGEDISGYNILSITGRIGEIVLTESKIIRKRTVPEGPILDYYQGIHYESKDWDGSDIFTTEKTMDTLVNGKLHRLLVDNCISNIDLYNVADLELPVYMFKNY